MVRFFLILFSVFTFLHFGYAENPLHIQDKTITYGKRTLTDTRQIDAVIIHTTYNASGGDPYDISSILRQFHRYHVGAHYLIGRDGQIFQLVNEKDIAWHAGQSRLPDGEGRVNSRSIGIEIINDTLDTPTHEQMISATKLVKQIQSRLPIRFILRHSDISPGRKTDPWNLNWDEFQNLIYPYNLGQR